MIQSCGQNASFLKADDFEDFRSHNKKHAFVQHQSLQPLEVGRFSSNAWHGYLTNAEVKRPTKVEEWRKQSPEVDWRQKLMSQENIHAAARSSTDF